MEIDAPVDRVWAEVTDFAAHTEWMEDAHAIRFATDQREGPGTVLLIDTRIGPLRTMDRFEITEIKPMLTVAGRHTGLFGGEGRFELSSPSPGRTRLVWRERIRFPWLLGGPAAALVGGVVLRRVWAKNLATLRRRIEG
ncbi:MAG: SRPBCC family protein [bacterium]|nr:SRPBCC family protein [bacterium]